MTTQGPSVDWKSLAAQAQPRRKTVRLCLRGDLLADLEQAQQDNGSGDVDGLRQQVEESTVSFVLAGLTRQKYRALEAAHPDPDGAGWDVEKFPEALVRACLVAPVVEASDPLFDVLTPAQVEQLFEAAFLTCNEVDEIPLLRHG